MDQKLESFLALLDASGSFEDIYLNGDALSGKYFDYGRDAWRSFEVELPEDINHPWVGSADQMVARLIEQIQDFD